MSKSTVFWYRFIFNLVKASYIKQIPTWIGFDMSLSSKTKKLHKVEENVAQTTLNTGLP